MKKMVVGYDSNDHFLFAEEKCPTIPDSTTNGIRISAVLGWEGIECAMTRLT